MSRQLIQTKRAPQPIGPYAQALRVGDLVFASGQIPLDPASTRLVSGDVDAEIRQVFENLRAVAEAAGTTLTNAVCSPSFSPISGLSVRLTTIWLRFSQSPNR